MKSFLVAFSAMGLLFLASCSHGGGESASVNLADENQPAETQASTENAPTQTQRTDSTTTTQTVETTTTAAQSVVLDMIQVSTGTNHTCALLENKTIKCWGNNDTGKLGDGTNDDNHKPVEVLEITNATQVSAGGHHTCALLENKTVKCWGSNRFGRLGDGPGSISSYIPVEVLEITNATQISVGAGHTCALLENKTIKCWGWNNGGQLGDGTGGEIEDHSLTPVEVMGITTAIQVSAGTFHTCALLENKTIKCWGSNDGGQLGNGTGGSGSRDDQSLTPVKVQGITNATQISRGGSHSCALLESKTIKCWGGNWYGQLGNGTGGGGVGSGDHSTTPVEVLEITNATQVSAGGTPCAVLSDKTIKCWGGNWDGQLGDGTGGRNDDRSTTPVQVLGITNATQISTAGGGHACAVLSDKTIKCWGRNYYGELGDGTSGEIGDRSLIPVQVIGLDD